MLPSSDCALVLVVVLILLLPPVQVVKLCTKSSTCVSTSIFVHCTSVSTWNSANTTAAFSVSLNFVLCYTCAISFAPVLHT